MTEIESRLEVLRGEPDYGGRVFSAADREAGTHRDFVGGRWDELGRHQLDFLIGQGLRPTDRFVDVGCGSLRAGRQLVDYLDPGNYYGIDINKSLIIAGYEDELNDDQRARLPLANLRHTNRFDADFGVEFDMAIAQSVFTHVSLNNARLCLYRISRVMRPGGRFFVTFFEGAPSRGVDEVIGKKLTERNPYWYYRADMRFISRSLPWRMRYIGDWNHPRGQRMVEYTRLTDREFETSQRRKKKRR